MMDGVITPQGNKYYPQMRFRDHPGLVKILTVCVSIQLVLIICDLTINWWNWSDSGAIRRLFNITREDGIASLFAVIQTLAVALTLWLIYFITSRGKKSNLMNTGWLFLAIFFSYLAIDDGAKVHERIGTVFKESIEQANIISYGWHYILAPVFVLCGVLAGCFLWWLGKDAIRRSFLVAALTLLGLAMLIDFVEGLENGYALFLGLTNWQETTVIHFSKSLEEFLEMLGMSLFLVLFLEYLVKLTWSIEIRISEGHIEVIEK